MACNSSTPKTPARKRLKHRCEALTIPPSPFLESLGYGTGVNVWKLQESKPTTRSPWAVKNIRKRLRTSLSSKYQDRIDNEANILKTLNHENIIGFRDYITSTDGRKCLAMELGGNSLGDMIEKRYEEGLGPYPPDDILKVVKSVASALEYLHETKNILHGDIKSYNIVVKDNFEVVKLCDFGVSVNLDENGTAPSFIGTAVYSAPECQEDADGPVTCKADIFSLGLVIWEMLALMPPHTNVNECQSYDDEDTDLDAEEGEMKVPSDTDSDSDVPVHEFRSDSESDRSVLSELSETYGTRPSLPSADLGPEYSTVIEMFYCCTEQDPNKRPTARFVCRFSIPKPQVVGTSFNMDIRVKCI